jgi:hypothetical protein
MEENQITCPQCGLVNNILADACVQCGIIFVKNPAMKAAEAAHDDEKRKSIEAAEALLDETLPSVEPVVLTNETIRRPDPHEDTVEIRIPQPAEIPDTEVESLDPVAPKPDDAEDEPTAEIELEAIETAMEAVTEPTDVESLFLSSAKADEPAKSLTAETTEESGDTPDDLQKTADKPAENDKPVSNGMDSQGSKANVAAAKESEAEAKSADTYPGSHISPESEKNPLASKASAEVEAVSEKPSEPVDSRATSTPKDEALPDEPEIQLELASEVTPSEDEAAQTAARDVPASPESLEKKAEADAQAKQQAQKDRQEALIKQQEALLKAEAHKKEEAARAKAAALKKKKLARAKAEALKKQKAAQAKAEALKKKKAAQAKEMALKKKKANQARTDALKKQKAAQSKAEASAEDVEVAAVGKSNYARLLGLLKKYKGKAIGINYDNSAEIKEAQLVEANEEFFSVMVKEKKVQYSYPLKTILTIVEGEQGVETETGEDLKKAKFDAVIKVYPLVLF